MVYTAILLYADFEEADESDGEGLFDAIIVTTTGNSAASSVARSSDWASHLSYGLKLSADYTNIVLVKDDGMEGELDDFDIYLHWRHKASSGHRVGVCWGANLSGDNDYEGGVMLWYNDGGNDTWLSKFAADGTPQDYSEYDTDSNIGALTDGDEYTLHMNIQVTTGSANITGEILNDEDVQISAVSESGLDVSAFNDEVAFLVYHTTTTDGNRLVVDELTIDDGVADTDDEVTPTALTMGTFTFGAVGIDNDDDEVTPTALVFGTPVSSNVGITDSMDYEITPLAITLGTPSFGAVSITDSGTEDDEVTPDALVMGTPTFGNVIILDTAPSTGKPNADETANADESLDSRNDDLEFLA